MERMSGDLEQSLRRVDRLRSRFDQLRRRLGGVTGIEDLERLDSSIGRRQARLRHLATQIEALESERRRLEGELTGCLHGAEALLTDLIDRLERLDGPCWSPVPVTGFTVFTVAGDGLHDGDHHWTRSALSPTCPTGSNDPPHTGGCESEPCGVLAWKSLDHLPDLVDDGVVAVAELAMSGRIVEHTDGYRARAGRIVGLVAFDSDRWFRTRDSRQIAAFAERPAETFDTLSAPIPDDGMVVLEVDLFLGGHR